MHNRRPFTNNPTIDREQSTEARPNNNNSNILNRTNALQEEVTTKGSKNRTHADVSETKEGKRRKHSHRHHHGHSNRHRHRRG